MLKFGGQPIVRKITELLNNVLTGGEYPIAWPKGTIVPIAKKKGKQLKVDEFHPICLLSHMSKIMEKIINNRLNQVVEIQGWLPEFQNGFRHNRSTLDNLLYLQQEIRDTFDKKEEMIAVFIDIKIAYDSVKREKLLNILIKKGIKCHCLKWLKKFLGKRKNRVLFNNVMSQSISPLLFNIYISGIQNICSKNISPKLRIVIKS